ncbi:hypothetical protein QTP88_026038 [Uroleucon formosanum]
MASGQRFGTRRHRLIDPGDVHTRTHNSSFRKCGTGTRRQPADQQVRRYHSARGRIVVYLGGSIATPPPQALSARLVRFWTPFAVQSAVGYGRVRMAPPQ